MSEYRATIGKLDEEIKYGLCWLDSNYFSDFNPGSIIKVQSDKHKASLRAMPRPDGEKMFLDETSRKILKVDYGDEVEFELVESESEKAEKVLLKNLGKGEKRKENYYKKALKALDLPLVEGGELVAGENKFKVKSYKPDAEVVRIYDSTNIQFEGLKKPAIATVGGRGRKYTRKGSKPSKLVTYDDIGGLDKQIHELRKVTELPIKNPEVYERLGKKPPKGVLLHGPPGCGKTLIGKALANETGLNYIYFSGSGVHGWRYGDSEAKVRSLFKKARESAPSILFIDEIDAMAEKRSEMSGERTVEKRVTDSLLSEMDSFEERGNVIVVGATNRPDDLDEALRRGGRFDEEIEIPVPDRDGRYEIFKIHTRDMTLKNKEELLSWLSDKTYGYSGADCEALCKKAVDQRLDEYVEDLFKGEVTSDEIDVEIGKEDFNKAMKKVHPSLLRELHVEKPEAGWDDVGGLKEVKERLRRKIERQIKYADTYTKEERGAGILLYGPPGCGKTLLAKAAAGECEYNFISVKGPEFESRWHGESERGIRKIFKKARQHAPCYIYFDEIDAILPERGTTIGDSGVSQRVVTQFSSELDGLEKLEDVYVIAATNRPDQIDKAVMRSGRLGEHFEVPGPDKKAREEIFEIHLRKKEIDLPSDLISQELATITEDYSGADIEQVCIEAKDLARGEAIEKYEGEVEKVKKELEKPIKRKYFEQALRTIKPSLKETKDMGINKQFE